jgi:hypothetical protein
MYTRHGNLSSASAYFRTVGVIFGAYVRGNLLLNARNRLVIPQELCRAIRREFSRQGKIHNLFNKRAISIGSWGQEILDGN